MIIKTGKTNRIIGINFDKKFEAEIITDFAENGNLILFPWRSCNLENCIEEYHENGTKTSWNDFILEHTIIKTKDDVFHWKLEENEYVLWFSPNNKEELMRIIKFGWLSYTCCVVPKGKDIRDHTYRLEMFEHDQYKGNEYRSLFIYEQVKGSFQRKILPIIQPKIDKYDQEHKYKHDTVYYFEDTSN
jgi:hypothetical protein